MAEAKRLKVPRAFVEDHCGRACAPWSIIERTTKRHAYIVVTAEQLAELASDARYYRHEARYMHPPLQYAPLGRSADATLRALEEQGVDADAPLLHRRER